MFALKRVKTSEVYRNCLKSMMKYDTVLKCFMSNDSKNIDDVLNLMKKKIIPKKEKVKKVQMKNANRVFELVKGDDNLKKQEAVEQKPVIDLTAKMNELIKTAEILPSSSPEGSKVSTAQKTQKTNLSDSDAKQKFLYNAKQVALTLGVDVEITQKELLQAYEDVGVLGNAPVRTVEFERSSNFKQKKQLPQKPEESNVQYEHFSSDMEKVALNIFKKNVGEKETQPILKTWNELKKIMLLHSSFRPPRNYFEELINWTNQGKIWRFPIDNDQDWHEEIATDFTDHVFLDKHLEPWCPKSGPIRHFMELVTTGLSKNPYLTAEKKKNHILWYRDYFQAKSTLLDELGVLDPKVDADAKKLEAGEN